MVRSRPAHLGCLGYNGLTGIERAWAMRSTVFAGIGEEDVRDWVGVAAYERGSQYYREGRVL